MVWLFVEDRLVPATTWPADVSDQQPVADVRELATRADTDHLTVVRDADGELGVLAITKAAGEFLTP